MLWNLLDSTASSSSSAEGSNWTSWLILGVFAVLLIVYMVYSRRQQKKKQDEQTNTLNAIKPGNKVKTIGGICGVVVEVCEDNTFVIETGTEASGKSYIKFDKQAIYQTDAVAEKPAPAPVAEGTEAPAVAEEKTEAKEEPEATETAETTEENK